MKYEIRQKKIAEKLSENPFTEELKKYSVIPQITLYESEITGDDFCSIIKGMLAIAYPNISEEERFEKAGMQWISEYLKNRKFHRGAKLVRDIEKLVAGTLFVWYDEWDCYKELCALFPEHYNLEGF